MNYVNTHTGKYLSNINAAADDDAGIKTCKCLTFSMYNKTSSVNRKT